MKISTKYINQVAKYINSFESSVKHSAVCSQFEIVEKAIKKVDSLINKKGISFLDLGSGIGNVLFVAKQVLGKGNKYIGIDYNQSYLDVSKFVDGGFTLLNIDLMAGATKKIISNSDIIYSYRPIPEYLKMMGLYKVIDESVKEGAYYLCNDENQPELNDFEKIERFEGYECCSRTDITIYRKTK